MRDASRHDLARARAIAESLRSSNPASGSAVAAVLPILQELLHAELAMAYALRPGETSTPIDFLEVAGHAAATARDRLGHYMASYPRGWPGIRYDPLLPAPEQQNRVQLHLAGDGSSEAIARHFDLCPATHAAFASAGIDRDHVRVLVCQRGTLLAWVGAHREEPFTTREAVLLGHLVPALRERLALDRELSAAHVAHAGLDAALEELGVAAFVLSAGVVVRCNAAGRALLDRDRLGTLAAVNDAARYRRRAGAFSVLPIHAQGTPMHHLVLARAAIPSCGEGVTAMTRRHGLTPRQNQTLSHLARGASNKEIAAQLGCGESTVELHVTSLLRRLDCENRAELVARVWRAAPPAGATS